MKLYLEMELLSDTCFAGSGGGRVGTVDTELETDPRTRLPIVRGRTLKGLLLEELAQILRALEKNGNGPWHKVATRLFGTPFQAERCSLTFGDGHLPDDLQAAVQCNRHLPHKRQYWTQAEMLAALTTVRHQTKIDAESGAPEAHSLRSARLLRAGLRLRAPVDARQPLDSAEQALFAACAVAVRRAGLHRNHGWGEVRVRVLDEQERDVTASWLIALRQPPTESPATEPSAFQPEPSSPVATGQRVIAYRLTLTAPAVLAMAGGETSTVGTRPYISGSAVLGALAWRWLGQQRPACADPAGDSVFQRYFLDGSIRWLNAYAASQDGKRLLPCPLSMVRRKDELNRAFDQASPFFKDLVTDEPNTQWKPLDLPFVGLQETEGAERTICRLGGRQLKLTARLHHTRDDREAGRSRNGVMFSYVSLAAGERFIGHILCETAEDAAVIRALLEAGPLPLGRSRTATYGGWAQVEILDEAAAEDWREAPARQEFTDEEQEQGRLAVTLLSDYLGVNDHGLPDPLALERDLREALGIDQKPIARFLGNRSVTGYVSHWRMPRPSHPAVTAGSVLVYENARPEPARLAELLWQGIGVRRTEGFGRVTVQWHGALEIQTSEEEEFLADSEPEAPSSPLSPELVFLQRNLLRNALRRALIHRAVEDANGVIRPPTSAALIGRLRARIRTAATADEVKNFLLRASYRPQDKGLKKAGQALTRARRGGKTLLDWLIAWMLGEDRNPPKWIGCPEVTDVCKRLKLEIDLLGDDDHWRLLQTYLDAFCEQLRRRAQKQSAGTTVRG
ncbi:MAG TPA: hypothetical protein PK880_10635 [Candidatus Competibacter sp.]|nr:hypothetical protein [Candidatus Competibacteraceae bacterium]HRC72974.1 hypothetical protein [Candidatus Competibacter sp.]